ncbi:hypothetical protein [Vibrio metschnikovii]|uniref:hypothetical protein n=1 Tax=Vibrio metschnikovii TaxID=28172 RepID=UPI001C30E467|nr:hypothetical protein [Vibrio metschnikovii]EJG1536688.1 hypothetical protein [Vibrio parahaemolyticus]
MSEDEIQLNANKVQRFKLSKEEASDASYSLRMERARYNPKLSRAQFIKQSTTDLADLIIEDHGYEYKNGKLVKKVKL